MAEASNIAQAQVPPEAVPQRIASETPRTHRTDGKHIKINQLRPQIGHEMDQEFVQCSFDDFMKAYMPFVPANADVDACIDSMLKSKPPVMKGDINNPRFTKFNENTSKDSTESVYFKPLEKIGTAIIGACKIQGRECRYPYQDLHTKPIGCVIDGSDNRCDGYFMAAQSDKLRTTSIAVPCEYKLKASATDIRNNNLQVVSANVQVMNADVRRKFTLGLTIDDDYMTLWYLSRSHSAVSERQNYVTNPRLLIQVFMSFTFAKPEEVGYDPEVTLNQDDSFTYKMPPSGPGEPSQFYRTVRSLSEYRSNNITGRMARIWLAAEVDSITAEIKEDTPQYVLKDVWLEKDAKTEKEIQEEIFKDIDEFLSLNPLPVEKAQLQKFHGAHRDLRTDQKYKKYFLTILSSHLGELSKPVAASSTRRRDLFIDPTLLFSYEKQGDSSTAKPGQSRKASQSTRQGSGTPRPLESKRNKEVARNFEQRKRYRVVFEEFCSTVGDLPTLGEVVDVLAQTLNPLQLLFCAGWVHRDISSGNILAHKDTDGNWMVKLSDLEYAKRFPPVEGYTAHVDPKTGTPFFMPHEILNEQYLYRDDKEVKRRKRLERQAKWDARNSHVFISSATLKTPVIHNFQHDLESLWWLLLWTITCRVPHKASNAFGETIFKNTIDIGVDRRKAFELEIEDVLAPALFPEIAHFAIGMEVLRFDLHDAAVNRSEDDLAQLDSYVELHMLFKQTFKELCDDMSQPWGRIKLAFHSAYLNAPAVGPDEPGDHVASAVASPEVPAASLSVASPLRMTPRLNPAPSNKRGRSDNPFSSDNSEDEGIAKRPKIEDGND